MKGLVVARILVIRILVRSRGSPLTLGLFLIFIAVIVGMCMNILRST